MLTPLLRRGLAVALLLTACGRSGPTPSIAAVTPSSGSNGVAVRISISGDGFSPMAVRVAEGAPQPAIPVVSLSGPQDVTLATEFVSATELQATVPAGIAVGVYSLTVTNPIGTSATLADAYTATLPKTLEITGITPQFGWTGSKTSVTISGVDFVSTPRVLLMTSPPTELARVAFLDSKTVTAVVPAGVAVGKYDVRVINPNGDQGDLAAAFTITADPPPEVSAVSPALGYTSSTTAVTITGSNFTPDAMVSLVSADGTETPATVGAVSGTTQVTATVPSALAAGNYLVRVTRPGDGAYGDFATFVVTQPSGNPGPWSARSTLPEPRRAAGAATIRDDLGNTYVYVAGGERGADGTNPAEIYRSVAVAPVSVFGRPGTWRTDASLLANRRREPVVFAHNGYLFVAGGFDETGAARSDLERARVLRSAGAPRDLAAEAGTGGSLASGSYYYRVSAIVSDADDPGGETLPSDFAVVSPNGQGKVSLTWAAPAEGTVTSYRVYRTPAANGALGEEVLLAENVSGTSFTDDGTGTTNPAVHPKPAGGLGTFVTLSTGLNAARGGAGVAVAAAPDGSGGHGAKYVYVLSGASGGGLTVPFADYEYAALPATGGDLPAFTLDSTHLLSAGRIELGIGVATATNASKSVAAGTSYIYVSGGQDPSKTTPTKRFPVQIDAGTVQPDGSLTFSLLTTTSTGAAGAISLVANDYLWMIGGWGGSGNYRASVFTGEISPTLAPQLTSMNNTGSALPGPRYLSAGAYERSTVFVIGGSSNGTDTLDTVLTSVF